MTVLVIYALCFDAWFGVAMNFFYYVVVDVGLVRQHLMPVWRRGGGASMLSVYPPSVRALLITRDDRSRRPVRRPGFASTRRSERANAIRTECPSIKRRSMAFQGAYGGLNVGFKGLFCDNELDSQKESKHDQILEVPASRQILCAIM